LQKDVNGINPVLWAVSLNRFEIMQEILQTIDRNESLLEEVLNQVFDLGNGSTLLLHSIEKQKQEIAKIIIEFADKYPNLSYSVLTKIGKNGASPLYMACAVGNADLVEKILESAKKNQNIFKKNLTQLAGQRKYSSFMIAVDYGHYDIVLKMLSFATSNSDLLEKMLLHSEISVGDSALIKAALKGDYLMVREIIRAAKAVPGLLEKIMLNSNILGFNAIFAASHNGKEEVVLEILKELSDNEVLLGKILKIKPNNSSPSISVNFILLGSDEAIKLLLLKFPELKIDNLPPAYRCNIPQTAIYYLEAFCNVEFLQKGKKKPVYYQLQDDEFKDVKIDNIKLSGTPILVEIEGRRTMLAKDFDIEDKSSLIEIQNLFDLASKNKVNNIVFNISSNKPAHLVSLSFSKTEKGIWSCVINDPEQHELKIYKEFIESFAKNSGIKIKISNKDYRVSDNGKKIADGLGRGGVIIPNYKTQSMSGYCDMISSMVSAALILGEEFCQDLRGYCVQQGRSCIVDLGKKLNPEVDKILKKRFDLVKQEIQPSPIISEVLSVGLKSGDYKEL
jgi:ankyrin repeat protein